MNRNAALGVLGAAATWAATGPAAAAVQPLPLQLRTMRVPFDHDRPEDGGFPLQFALLRPFDAQKPTVAVVSDGQQFFVTAEAFRRTIEKIFDERFNVVGVFGRGQSADCRDASAPPTAASIGCSRTDFCAPGNGSETSKRCAKHCSVRMASCCCTVARAER